LGRHAFATLPAQARFLSERHPEVVSEGQHGLAAAWDMPVALWRADRGFDLRYPANDHATLSIVLAGRIARQDGRFRGRADAPSRDRFILYPGGHDRHYAASGAARICQIYVPADLVRTTAEEAGLIGAAGLALRDDRVFAADLELRAMLDQYLRRSLDPQAEPTALEMDCRAVLIALRLAQHHSSLAATRPPGAGSLSPERLRRVTDYMLAHLAEPLGLAELAAVAGLSRHHFATAFRRATGEPPHRFLMLRRVDAAQARLRAGEPAAAVAYACGFCSQQHFSAVFRSVTGSPPVRWLRADAGRRASGVVSQASGRG
jgi:AraC family transcriptional regulator